MPAYPHQSLCPQCGSAMSDNSLQAYCSMCTPPKTQEQKQALGVINPIMDRVDKDNDRT